LAQHRRHVQVVQVRGCARSDAMDIAAETHEADNRLRDRERQDKQVVDECHDCFLKHEYL
jgi:hypothetical protein